MSASDEDGAFLLAMSYLNPRVQLKTLCRTKMSTRQEKELGSLLCDAMCIALPLQRFGNFFCFIYEWMQVKAISYALYSPHLLPMSLFIPGWSDSVSLLPPSSCERDGAAQAPEPLSDPPPRTKLPRATERAPRRVRNQATSHRLRGIGSQNERLARHPSFFRASQGLQPPPHLRPSAVREHRAQCIEDTPLQNHRQTVRVLVNVPAIGRDHQPNLIYYNGYMFIFSHHATDFSSLARCSCCFFILRSLPPARPKMANAIPTAIAQ
jgi:hypothetical protein